MTQQLHQQCKDVADLCIAASAEDTSMEVRGIVWMEHINLVVGDRARAETFYFQGLGLTRDPARPAGGTMWANIGPRQQFHLVDATDEEPAQVVNGSIGLALPDLGMLRKRLAAVKSDLQNTRFKVEDFKDCLVVTCPWGNIFFVYSTCSKPRPSQLSSPAKRPRTIMEQLHEVVDGGMAVRGEPGIRFLRLCCKEASRVAAFYADLFGCPTRCQGSLAAVCVGPTVHLVFDSAPVDLALQAAQLARGIHVCVYISDFKRVYEALQARGLIWTNPRFAHLDNCDTYEAAAADRQLRFRSICDAEGKEQLLELEHEVRALRHLQFMKEVYYIAK